MPLNLSPPGSSQLTALSWSLPGAIPSQHLSLQPPCLGCPQPPWPLGLLPPLQSWSLWLLCHLLAKSLQWAGGAGGRASEDLGTGRAERGLVN